MYLELKGKLWAFIIENNPELMFELNESGTAADYIDANLNKVLPLTEELLALGKSLEEVEQSCLNAMTLKLKPSKFLYIRSIIEEDFPDEFKRLVEDGIMTYTVIGMIAALKDVFMAFGFTSETVDTLHLRHAVIAQLHNFSLG